MIKILDKTNSNHSKRFAEAFRFLDEVEVLIGDRIDDDFRKNNNLYFCLGIENIDKVPSEIQSSKIVIATMAYDLVDGYLSPKQQNLIKNRVREGCSVLHDCQTSSDIFNSKFGLPRRLLVVPYGAEIEMFTGFSFRRESTLKIISYRSWTDTHNNLFFIDALSSCSNLPIELNVIKPDNEIIQKKLKAKNTHNFNIKFLSPSRQSIIESMDDSWLYLTSSKTDGTSLSLLESLAAAKICLVPNLNSNMEMIEHGVNGFLYESNKKTSLINQIYSIYFLTNAKLAVIAANGRATAIKKGRWETNKRIIVSWIREQLILGKLK